MKLKYLYLALAILGLVLPYSQYVPFHLAHGPDLILMFKEQFSTNATSFFGFDLLVAAVAAVIFMIIEGRRLKIKRWWIPVVLTFLIGVGFAFPLFLYMRER